MPGKPLSTISVPKQLKRAFRPWRRRFVALAAVNVVSGVAEAGILVLIARLGLGVVGDLDRVELLGGVGMSQGTTIAVTAGLIVVRVLLGLVWAWLAAGLVSGFVAVYRRRLASAFLGAPWAVQQEEPSGQLHELVVGYSNRTGEIVNYLCTAVTAAFSLLAFLAVSFLVDPVASIGVVVLVVVLGLALRPLGRRIRNRSTTVSERQLELAESVSQFGALGLEIHSFGVQDAVRDHLEEQMDQSRRAQWRVVLLGALVTPLYTAGAYAVVLLAIAILIATDVSDLASFGAVMLVMLRSLAYGQGLQAAWAQILSQMPFLDSIEDTIRRYEETPTPGGSTRVEEVGELTADGLGFAYQPGRPVLDDLDFRIPPHEMIGIVGPSGSGKSTLVQLLLGVREPTRGTLRTGAVDLTDVDRRSWTARVAFVPQEARLFSGTVAENVRFFRTGCTLDEVEKACRLAHVHEEIAALPLGYETEIGDRGSRLSGGQRQRLALARGLLGSPDLLILDEPTSALDVHSESLIRDTLQQLRGKITIVVIAHRLSTLEHCDRIMVIQDGRVLAFGPASELEATSGFYQDALRLSGLR